MNFRHLSFVGAVMAFAVIVLWLGQNLAVGAEVPVPKDFSYGEKNPLGAVPFSHKFHVTEKKLACPDCHTKIFQMKKMVASKDMTMAKLNGGEFCGNCHNGEKTFSTKEAKDCAKCHVKKK